MYIIIILHYIIIKKLYGEVYVVANILDKLKDSMEIYQAAYPVDVCIVLCSTEKIYGYLPGKEIDIKVEEGKSMDHYEESAAAQVLKTGKRIQKEIGPEFLGIAYVVTATPIYENGKLVGSISIVASNKKLDSMRSVSKELVSTVEAMSESTDQIAISSNEVTDFIQELSNESETMANDIKSIDSMLATIQKSAMQAKILGLNASIEAARAGEAGKGFAVVSNEVQKMGKESEQFSEQINTQLEHIKKAIENLNESIQRIAANTEEHAAGVQELKASFENINSMTRKLLDIAMNES